MGLRAGAGFVALEIREPVPIGLSVISPALSRGEDGSTLVSS